MDWKDFVPFSWLTALTINDDEGLPWVPSRRTNFVIVPAAAIGLGIFSQLLGYENQDYELTNLQMAGYTVFAILWWWLVMNPIFRLNRRWRLKNRTEEGNAYQDDKRRWP